MINQGGQGPTLTLVWGSEPPSWKAKELEYAQAFRARAYLINLSGERHYPEQCAVNLAIRLLSIIYYTYYSRCYVLLS